MGKISWGIIGTGHIANKFANAIGIVDEAELFGVASRDILKAQDFMEKHNCRKAYGCYEEMVCDEGIDAVYIATPHTLHKENMLLCINAGKAVLCEKPFTLNADDAKEVMEAAREKGVFVMEAMWTRCLPAIRKSLEWIKLGYIGEVRMFYANFGFVSNRDPLGRHRNPNLAGGALLDVGVYPITLASLVFGAEPKVIASSVFIGDTGVDEHSAMIFDYENGGIASISCGIDVDTDKDTLIVGTKGKIKIEHFSRADETILFVNDEIKEIFREDFIKNGFEYEIREASNAILNNRLESEQAPIEATINVLEVLDKLRKQWGLLYPSELDIDNILQKS